MHRYECLLSLLNFDPEHSVFYKMPVSTCFQYGVFGIVDYVKRSTVLVGVQGAGLQWSVFMSPGSTLIEIAWPQKHWGFYYRSVKRYQIKHREVRAKAVHINWSVYEAKVHNGKKLTAGQRKILGKSPPKKPPSDNVWKWADVEVNVQQYRASLCSVKHVSMTGIPQSDLWYLQSDDVSKLPAH
jgi:adenomatosis polyposis coli protein